MTTRPFLSVLILAVLLAFSQAVLANVVSEETLRKIIENEAYCVEKYEHDESKIYLHSDCILPTSEGIFLNLNGHEYVQITTLRSDHGGCWVATEKVKILNDCPYCGEEYFITCKNPNCPGKKKGK